jgi:glycine cleavage system transcriptional repressor
MKWSVLTLVGADQQGIVAKVTQALFDAGCQLAEASMMRLGGNFAIMLRVSLNETQNLKEILRDVTQSLNLHMHIDEDVAAQTHHIEPDVRIRVYGADRPGIVSQVTGVLAESGFNIIDLETAIAGDQSRPIYIMSMEGNAQNGLPVLEQAIKKLDENIDISLMPIDTLRA